jgi:uncharacterized protein
MKIAYLHGLESPSKSEKSDWLHKNFPGSITPEMDYARDVNLFNKTLKLLSKKNKIDLIVGSSMGGYFAHHLSTITGIPALLFNPAFQGRATEPKIKKGSIKSDQTVVIGTNDKVVIPEDSLKYINDKAIGSFEVYHEKNGHRVPMKLFTKYINKVSNQNQSPGISESGIFLKYSEFILEASSGEVLNPTRGKIIKFDHKKYPELAKEFYDLIQIAYKEIGGHVKIRKPDDIYSDPKWNWWAGKDIHGTNDLDLIMFGQKNNFGIKFSGVGHDGERDSKKEYLKDRSVDLKKLGYYVEVSGKLADILINKYNVPVVDDQETVKDVLGKPVVWEGSHPDDKSRPGKGWYTRYLAGKPHTKILLGRPKI